VNSSIRWQNEEHILVAISGQIGRQEDASLICFAILAHDNEEVLVNQVANIKKFNPGSMVVLYNGGHDSNFGKQANVPVCPASQPLSKGRLGRFFLDIMTWLEETGIHYDFLVNLDSDVMFVQPGFETFLHRVMQGYDCMGINMGVQHSPGEVPHWYPGQTMWEEWDWWQPFFQTDYFCGTLNSMQVYRRHIVARIVSMTDKEELERRMASTRVFALEEILYATLAVRLGANCRPYPHESTEFVRLGKPLSLDEVKQSVWRPHVFFVHPIARDLDDPARQYITSLPPDVFRSLTIIWGCYQGGVETAIHYRLQALNQRGARAHAYFYYGGAGLLNYQTIPYHCSSRPDDLGDYIRQHSFDIITFINTIHNIEQLPRAGFRGKVLFEFHGFDHGIQRELQRINRGEDGGLVQAVVVPARHIAGVAHEHLTERRELAVYVAPNLIDTQWFHKQSNPNALRLPPSWSRSRLIGWVGRLDANKNWKLLLRIVRRVRSRHPDVKLLIASDIPTSPDFHDFYTQASRYSLLDHFRLFPNIPYRQMPQFYSAVAASGGVLLSTSYSEGYPYNLLEAQACECPVVCTDTTGNREVVEHGKTGLVFPCSDLHEAVSHIEKLFKNLQWRAELTARARKTVLRRNNIHNNTEQYLQWVHTLLQADENTLGNASPRRKNR
jgi:glycosyltransferase involved in cell wall biosynthesis